MAKCFPLVLDDVAQRWFWSLPPDSMSTWGQLRQAFCNNFQGTFVEPMTAGNLFAIKQRPEESLRYYFRHFTAAKSQIRGLSDSTIIDAAKQGVLEGTEFFSKLSRKHITSVEKLMDKFEEYARGEEENMRRRAAKGLPPLPPRAREAPAVTRVQTSQPALQLSRTGMAARSKASLRKSLEKSEPARPRVTVMSTP